MYYSYLRQFVLHATNYWKLGEKKCDVAFLQQYVFFVLFFFSPQFFFLYMAKVTEMSQNIFCLVFSLV